MSKQWLTIEFDNLDNEAFSGEGLGPELARILHRLAYKFEVMSRAEFVNDDADGKLKDVNGNTVGSVSGSFVDDEDDQDLYDEVRRITKWMSHHEIAKFVEDHCSCFVSSADSEEVLIDTIVDAIKDGDITIGDLEDFRRA